MRERVENHEETSGRTGGYPDRISANKEVYVLVNGNDDVGKEAILGVFFGEVDAKLALADCISEKELGERNYIYIVKKYAYERRQG